MKWNQKSNGYRLPTEAEWEYAAIGGDKYKYFGSNNIDEVGWYIKNSGKETHPVGQKKPNGFGLYDMCGNVVELVWDSSVIEEEHDLTGASLYTSKSQTDPVYIDTSTSTRIARGGSYWYNAWRAHVSKYFWDYGSKRHNNVGFRFLRTL